MIIISLTANKNYFYKRVKKSIKNKCMIIRSNNKYLRKCKKNKRRSRHEAYTAQSFLNKVLRNLYNRQTALPL